MKIRNHPGFPLKKEIDIWASIGISIETPIGVKDNM